MKKCEICGKKLNPNHDDFRENEKICAWCHLMKEWDHNAAAAGINV